MSSLRLAATLIFTVTSLIFDVVGVTLADDSLPGDALLSAGGNRVGGNMQVFKNGRDATITNNTIDGNLQCKENPSAPFGGNNIVQGNKEDQCAEL